MKKIVDDFIAECDALEQLLEGVSDSDWAKPTQFFDWTLEDVLLHLHFWNKAVDMALLRPEEFQSMMKEVMVVLVKGGLRGTEDARVKERGVDLFHVWRDNYRQMREHWSELDPKHRVAWAGPDMSVRSAITARQMETWAHSQEIFDLMGVERQEDDRIRNIVVLCVNTYGWSYKVRGLETPGPMPQLHLTSPSGELWSFGEEGENSITGSAVQFAQVSAQTRNIADTDLVVVGPIAEDWMAHAQCFAGPPEKVPEPGTRYRMSG